MSGLWHTSTVERNVKHSVKLCKDWQLTWILSDSRAETHSDTHKHVHSTCFNIYQAHHSYQANIRRAFWSSGTNIVGCMYKDLTKCRRSVPPSAACFPTCLQRVNPQIWMVYTARIYRKHHSVNDLWYLCQVEGLSRVQGSCNHGAGTGITFTHFHFHNIVYYCGSSFCTSTVLVIKGRLDLHHPQPEVCRGSRSWHTSTVSKLSSWRAVLIVTLEADTNAPTLLLVVCLDHSLELKHTINSSEQILGTQEKGC